MNNGMAVFTCVIDEIRYNNIDRDNKIRECRINRI